MVHWLFLQHPYMLLLLGALTALVLVSLGVFLRRLYDYWLWSRTRQQRERDVVIAAVASLAAMQLAAIANTSSIDVDAAQVANVQ